MAWPFWLAGLQTPGNRQVSWVSGIGLQAGDPNPTQILDSAVKGQLLVGIAGNSIENGCFVSPVFACFCFVLRFLIFAIFRCWHCFTVCSLALNLFTTHYISMPLPSAMWVRRGTARGFDVVACLFRDLRDSGFLVPKKSLRLFGRSASVVKAFEEFQGGFLTEQPEVEARLENFIYRPLAWRLTSTFTLFDGCGFWL